MFYVRILDSLYSRVSGCTILNSVCGITPLDVLCAIHCIGADYNDTFVAMFATGTATQQFLKKDTL